MLSPGAALQYPFLTSHILMALSAPPVAMYLPHVENLMTHIGPLCAPPSPCSLQGGITVRRRRSWNSGWSFLVTFTGTWLGDLLDDRLDVSWEWLDDWKGDFCGLWV